MHQDMFRRPSLFDLPPEIRVKIYPSVFGGSVIHFDPLWMRWIASESALLFTSKTTYAESVPLLWQESMINLPNCILAEGCDDDDSCSLITSTLSESLRSKIRHIRIDIVRTMTGYTQFHIFTEAGMFRNIESLTVRRTVDLRQDELPNTYFSTLTEASALNLKRTSRFGLPHSVALFFETSMPGSDGRMTVTTDEDHKTILRRLDTATCETGEVVVLKSWTDGELARWKDPRELLWPYVYG